jgi:hypothetical protein
MAPSVEQITGDRRAEGRSSLYLAASLYCDGASSPVKIRNISSTGALLESRTVVAGGSLVQLVRGSLIVHGLVAWTENEKLGLKFSGSVDVQQWRMTPNNAEQQRIDDIVRLVKAGAVPLPISAPSHAVPTDEEGPSADLQRASRLLANLGDRLANDAIVVALYSAELQNLDIAIQVIDAVKSLLGSESDVAAEPTKFDGLRRSADQALSRAAA